VRSSRAFTAEARSIGAARRYVRDALRHHPRAHVDAIELMLSELATNAVKHAHSDFKVSIDDSGGEIRVEVRDTGRGQPVLRSPTPIEPSGRGLRIVEALSRAWGTVDSPHGKTVWFTLPSKATAAAETG
jgi:anti-sigma regulatory factor (Ser/Thr protein kinase)